MVPLKAYLLIIFSFLIRLLNYYLFSDLRIYALETMDESERIGLCLSKKNDGIFHIVI